MAISGANYDASLHDYVINDATKVGYGTDAFQANCIKCHADGNTAFSKRQDGTYKLSVHLSAESRIAKALGAALTGAGAQTEENLCYGCHTGATAGNDYYGVQAMSQRARSIQAQFAKTYKHNVAGYAGIHRSDEYGAAPTQVDSGHRDRLVGRVEREQAHRVRRLPQPARGPGHAYRPELDQHPRGQHRTSDLACEQGRVGCQRHRRRERHVGWHRYARHAHEPDLRQDRRRRPTSGSCA